MVNPVFTNKLIIKGKVIKFPIVQGGMGVGVSFKKLPVAVAKEGGVGTISSACLNMFYADLRAVNEKNMFEAVYRTVAEVREEAGNGGFIAINIMRAIDRFWKVSVEAAVSAGADAIVSGAGLPLDLPAIARSPKDTALIPIVSSVQAFGIILKRWERFGCRPDAVIVECPLAGGHLGFKMDEIWEEKNRLEYIFPPIKELAIKNGDIPVIAAGGIYSHEDSVRWLELGANGLQLGTRFLVTEESEAILEYKNAVVQATGKDIVVSDRSPCGFPIRILRTAPMYVESENGLRSPKCDKGYLLRKNKEGQYTECLAKSNKYYMCVCNGLLASGGYLTKEKPLYTVGSNAYRVNKILSVKELMNRLKGLAPED